MIRDRLHTRFDKPHDKILAPRRTRSYDVGVRAPLVVVFALTAGCGGPMAQLRTDNHRMATTVDELRAELRAERRKSKDLENQIFLLTDRLETAQLHGGGGVPVAAPTLPVEVLSPDDVPENGTLLGTSDDGTEIVYLGDAAAPPADVELGDERDAIEPAPAPRPVKARPSARPLRELPTSAELGVRTRAPADDDEGGDGALALYRRATAALEAKDHAGAIALFRDLIARYPQHEYADNAQYWLGEAFYDQKDYAHAVTEFRATVTGYPSGNKVPDALLKIGLSYAALGDPGKARAALEQVVRLYPKTSPAAIAAARLEQLP